MSRLIRIGDLQESERINKLIDGEEYIRICEESDLADSRGIRVVFGDEFSDLGDLELAIIRHKGKSYAVSNICPHKHAPKIAEGIIKDGTVTCPLHGWSYDLETGCNTNTKDGIKKLEKYEVALSGGWVYIKKPDPKIPAWRTATL